MIAGPSIKPNAPTPRRGLSLVELLLSMAAAGVLMAGMASAVAVTVAGSNLSASPLAERTRSQRSLNQVARDIKLARDVTELSTTAITLTVPDRTGDGVLDTVRYAWSGTAGAPFTCRLNGGSVLTEIPSVSSLAWRSSTTVQNGDEPTVVPYVGPVTIASVSSSFAASLFGLGGAKSLTIDAPSGTAPGDLLLAFLAIEKDVPNSVSFPSGWTELAVEQGNKGTVLAAAWFEPTSVAENYAFAWEVNSDAAGCILRISGHESGSPIVGEAYLSDNQGTSFSAICPETGSAPAGCLVLRAAAVNTNALRESMPGMPNHTLVFHRSTNLSASVSATLGVAATSQQFATDVPTAFWALQSATDYASITVVVRPAGAG